MELADTLDLGSNGSPRAGSSPVARTRKTVDALHRRFFNEINPVGFVKYASRVKYCYAMWNVLRHIGIYFISFDVLASNFTMTAGHYFTFASGGYFTKILFLSICAFWRSIPYSGTKDIMNARGMNPFEPSAQRGSMILVCGKWCCFTNDAAGAHGFGFT